MPCLFFYQMPFVMLPFKENHIQLVPIHKWPIGPISVLREEFNPRNIGHMPAVKFFVRLDLDPICLFVDGHQLELLRSTQRKK